MATGKINTNEWRELPITVTTTTGDIDSGYIKVFANDDMLFVNTYNMNRGAQTSVGNNMYAATISGLPDFYTGTITCVYAGTSLVIVHLLNYGGGIAALTARVLVSDLPANTQITARGFLKR